MSSAAGPSSRINTDNLPPGSYHTKGTNRDIDSDSGSSVQAYDEPPDYLRRDSNKDAPILVDSSDDEAGPVDTASAPKAEEDEDKFLQLWAVSERELAQPPVSSRKRRREEGAQGFKDDKREKRKKRSSRCDSRPASSSDATPSPKHPAGPSVPPAPPSPFSLADQGPSPLPSESFPEPDYEPPNALTQVLDILPDIDQEWVNQQIAAELAAGRADDIPHRVVGAALEIDGGYPRIKEKGKEMANIVEDGAAEAYKSLEYKRAQRVGSVYFQKAMLQLDDDFPAIPLPHVRSTFYSLDYLYVPAYYRLVEQSEAHPKPYQELKRPRAPGKGKAKNRQSAVSHPGRANDIFGPPGEGDGSDFEGNECFDEELAWLQKALAKDRSHRDAEEAKRLAHEEALANGEGVECGCCFGEEVVEEMFQCSDGHLFCRECATKHAETKLGEQLTSIQCMDTSGCESPFPESELTRLLSAKSLSLYHRLKQAKELEQADIEGLETCPSCPFAAVIDNPDEKLFRCQNEDCRQVTCRGCRRKEHIPRTCAEVEADLKLNNRHTVEDAMSEALIRKCPKCAKPYVKESGCNKIMCTKCSTLSCYICQKAIAGYDHFDQNDGDEDPGNYAVPKVDGKCALWDRSEHQNDEQAIRQARDAAQVRVRAAAEAAGIELGDKDLDVELPAAPGVAPLPGRNAGLIMPVNHMAMPQGAIAVPVHPDIHQVGVFRGIRNGPQAINNPLPAPPPMIDPLPARFRHNLPGVGAQLAHLQAEAERQEEQLRALVRERNPPGEDRLWRRNGIE